MQQLIFSIHELVLEFASNIAGLFEKQKIITPVFTHLFLVTYDSPHELLFNLDAKGVCQIKVPRN